MATQAKVPRTENSDAGKSFLVCKLWQVIWVMFVRFKGNGEMTFSSVLFLFVVVDDRKTVVVEVVLLLLLFIHWLFLASSFIHSILFLATSSLIVLQWSLLSLVIFAIYPWTQQTTIPYYCNHHCQVRHSQAVAFFYLLFLLQPWSYILTCVKLMSRSAFSFLCMCINPQSTGVLYAIIIINLELSFSPYGIYRYTDV